MDLSDFKGRAQFTVEGEASVVVKAWRAWIKEFEAFADAKSIFTAEGFSANAVRPQTQRIEHCCYTVEAHNSKNFLEG